MTTDTQSKAANNANRRALSTCSAPLAMLAALLVVASIASAQTQAGKPTPPQYQFPAPLSSQLPYDVDIAAVRKLTQAGEIAEAQRLFDILAWQAFLALNWPARADGQPDPAKDLKDSQSPRVWEFFRESGTVFLADGKAPEAWSGSSYWKTTAQEAASGAKPTRKLWMSEIGDPHGPGASVDQVDENLQAFTGPLIDQEGKWVRYEVLVNDEEFNYLFANKLYSLEGQADYVRQHPIEFPINDGDRKHGAIEIKLAWKQLDRRDDPARFLVRRASVRHMIADAKGNLPKDLPWSDETMGLVGMHISMRTESSPTWIWATFEHVDNTTVNSLERDSHGRPLRPLFNNPDSPTQTVNILAPKNAAPDASGFPTTWAENLTTTPTQVFPMFHLTGDTKELNREVQDLLRNAGSVFQYYQLNGTQWPIDPAMPAFAGGVASDPSGKQISSAPESIIFKVPGRVVPVYLINSTMETFFQNGNQPAGPLEEDDRLPAGVLSDSSRVFGTESCNGCHFSAGACVGFKRDLNGKSIIDATGHRMPIYGKDGSFGHTGNANYSWLLQMRAGSPPVTTK